MTNQKRVTSQVENKEVAAIEMPEDEVMELLMNAICAQQEHIEKMEEQITDLNQQFVKIAQILAGHQERYESFQEFIHSYLDLPTVVRLVSDIADEVGIDVKDYYPKPTIQ